MILLFGGLLLLAFGAFMLFAPGQFFALTESWKSNTPSEPSDLFILSTRIGGAFFMLVGIVSIVVFFLD